MTDKVDTSVYSRLLDAVDLCVNESLVKGGQEEWRLLEEILAKISKLNAAVCIRRVEALK